MTFEPTTNRIPFMMLTEVEREELKAWPHGWENFHSVNKEWENNPDPQWFPTTVYRGKPKPPVVTSKWINVYSTCRGFTSYASRESADNLAERHRIAVLRIDTCNGVSTAHLEEI